MVFDLGNLKAVPGLEVAVEAHAAAERVLAANPELAEGNPEAFKVVFCLLAWAKSGGDNAVLVRELQHAARRANLKEA